MSAHVPISKQHNEMGVIIIPILQIRVTETQRNVFNE